MPGFTDDDLVAMFGDRTYERGLDYYQSGNVSDPMVLDGVLYAEVWGSAEEPYETSVTIEDGDVFSDCTCPVGDMCKHGVAVLLTWMKDPSTFTDGDKALKSLEGRSKEELLELIKKLLSRHRGLIGEIGVPKADAKSANVSALMKKIEHTVSSGCEYHDGYRLVRKLEAIADEADALSENGRPEDAARIYLKLVESCLEVYEEYCHESDDEFGSFVVGCSEAFAGIASDLDDEFKDGQIDAVLALVWRDDWSIGLENMLSAIITSKNIESVRQRVVRDIKADRNGHLGRMQKDIVIDLLSNINKSYGKPGEKVRIAEECLVEKDDYVRYARAVLDTGDLEGAFAIVLRGLAVKNDTSPSIRLNELYFELASRLVERKPELIDYRASLIPALSITSAWFKPDEYALVSGVFRRIGRLDDLHDFLIRHSKNRDTVAMALIYDGNVKAAVKLAAQAPNMHPDVLFKVARAAKEKGMPDESASLLRTFSTGVKRFWEHIPPDDLIDLMVNRSGTPSLKDVCDNIVKNGLSGFGAKMIPALAKKSPDLAARLLKEFYYDMPAGAVADASRAISVKLPEQMMAICMGRVNHDCLRSHVHYDDALLLLKALRDIYGLSGKKPEWPGAIRQFATDNKGKKKLIGKLEAAFGADLR
jgi:uncharacterized Zn finger protein